MGCPEIAIKDTLPARLSLALFIKVGDAPPSIKNKAGFSCLSARTLRTSKSSGIL